MSLAPLAWRGVEAEADHAKDPRYVTRRTHARFTDLIVHFRMDWRRVCRGIDGSRWAVCGDIDGSCSVCAGIGSSRFGALCAINCFGAPLNLAELRAGVSSAPNDESIESHRDTFARGADL